MDNEIYDLLKKDIEVKIGEKIQYSKDCTRLSKKVREDTQRQISVSTIKRFFGIIQSPFKTSKYTLETFAQFVGFEGWEDYLNYYDNSKYSESASDVWNALKNRITAITRSSLSSMKEKSGYIPERTILRSFAKEKFEKFLQSPNTAAVFVAPDGFGKTTTIVQLVEQYFTEPNAKHKNDIAFLIDGGIFFNLYSKNSNFELFGQFLEFKIRSSIEFYFQQNPERRKGRIIVFIDDVDEIFFEKERYHYLMENLMRMIMSIENTWYKMVLTCKPENLGILNYLLTKNPLYKSSWFKMDFTEHNMTDARNIPLYSKLEIKEILKKWNIENAHKEFTSGFLFKFMRNPFFLSLAIEQFNQTGAAGVIPLLKTYLEKKLNSSPYRDDKIIILDSLIELCNWGKETDSVEKMLLMSNTEINKIAYRELIAGGIIYEYPEPEGLLGKNTYIRFNQSIVFEYLLLGKWRQKSTSDNEVFAEIESFYKKNVQMQNNLFEVFIKVLEHEGKHQTLKKLFGKMRSQSPRIRRSQPVIEDFEEGQKNRK